jgi:hypothetical protein
MASGRRRLLLDWVPWESPGCLTVAVTHSGLGVVMHSGLLVDNHGEADPAKESAQLVFVDPFRMGRRYRLVRLCSTVSSTDS